MIDIPVEISVAIGLFLGCLARALLPFFKKRAKAAEQDELVKWESRYIWTIIFAIFSAFIVATFLFPSVEIPATNAFPVAFAMGWSAQDITNMMVK